MKNERRGGGEKKKKKRLIQLSGRSPGGGGADKRMEIITVCRLSDRTSRVQGRMLGMSRMISFLGRAQFRGVLIGCGYLVAATVPKLLLLRGRSSEASIQRDFWRHSLNSSSPQAEERNRKRPWRCTGHGLM